MCSVGRVALVVLRKPPSSLFLRYAHNESEKKNYIQSVQKYAFTSFYDFVKNYETKVEVKFPAAIRIYRIVKIGLQDFFSEMKLFVQIVRKINANDKGLDCLSRRELEVYHRMPKDMLRVAPVLLISALPFANYVTFPLAYMFPRQLLSSHFWSLQQRIEFAVLDQKYRLKHYKPVFRRLQAKLTTLKQDPLFPSWARCIALLGSGLHPRPDTITQCIPLFGEGAVYHIDNLTATHVRYLCKMHSIGGVWRRRKKLSERAALIQLMDQAILREGGVSALSQDQVRMACFLRGLNPTSMNVDEAVSWLRQWTALTAPVPSDAKSYILHLPILTAYNHPSNWVLSHPTSSSLHI